MCCFHVVFIICFHVATIKGGTSTSFFGEGLADRFICSTVMSTLGTIIVHDTYPPKMSTITANPIARAAKFALSSRTDKRIVRIKKVLIMTSIKYPLAGVTLLRRLKYPYAPPLVTWIKVNCQVFKDLAPKLLFLIFKLLVLKTCRLLPHTSGKSS